MSFSLIGTGRAHPANAVTNHQMAALVDTDDDWIVSRSGIKSRYIASHETSLDLAAAAGRQALHQSGLQGQDLDLILCATMQGDNITPSLACMLQKELAANCPAFDLNAACSGFLYALDVAAAYLDSGRARAVLVVAAEMMSKHLDWSHRSTCVLFGDGAGAVVLKKGGGLLAMHLTAKTDEESLLLIPGSNNRNPFYTGSPRPQALMMSGRKVFRFAVQAMVRDINLVLNQAGLTIAEVALVVAHQANLRILDAAAKALGLQKEQLAIGIDRYGNTSCASIPILLAELQEAGRLRPGDHLVLAAFGGGLTSSACVIRL